MEFKVNRETISVTECIFEGVQEQGVEFDYILPDYYPDIFKLVRCEVMPTVTDYNINGDKLNYELRCDMRILYCSETGAILQCINQKQCFSRTLDIGKFCDNVTAEIKPKTDYVNYRAVNKRRFDMRGAVSVKIRLTGEKKQEVVCDAFGLNVKLKKMPVKFAEKRVSSIKTIQLNEEIEISSSQPSIINVVRCVCQSVSCDKKIISGKIMAKGEAQIKVLYACEKNGSGAIEPIEFTMPFSQILDMEGLDEHYEVNVVADAVYCEAVPTVDNTGESKVLKCESEIRLECRGIKSESVLLGADAYSTTHLCDISMSEIKAEQVPILSCEELHHNTKLFDSENMPESIYDLWCEPKNINTRFLVDEKKIVISGMLTYTTVGKDSAGLIIMSDKEEAFEETIELDNFYPDGMAKAEVNVKNVSYNITADNTLIAKSDIKANISIYTSSSIKAVTDIIVDDSVKIIRDGDYALKLYYGIENEDIWDIAKRYSTSADAIMEENDLYGEKLEQNGMLIIPIVL